MKKAGCRASFLTESRLHASLFNEVWPNHFNGDRSVERLVHSGVHRTHAPAANAPFQPVTLRKDSRHVHTDQSGSVLGAHRFARVETHSTFRAFLKALLVRRPACRTCQ